MSKFKLGDRVQIENYSDTGTIVDIPKLSGLRFSAPQGCHNIQWDNTGWSCHNESTIFPAGKTLAQEIYRLASEANEALISYRDALDNVKPARARGEKLFAAIDALTSAIVEEANR